MQVKHVNSLRSFRIGGLVGISLLLVEPALASSINPESLTAHSVLIEIVADAALLSTVPAALVLAIVFPDKSAVSMALVLLKLSLVLLAVGPHEVSVTMHFIV